MEIYGYINALVDYGIDRQLLAVQDKIYARNLVLECMRLDFFKDEKPERDYSLEEILKALLDDCVSRGVSGDSVTERDLLDTKLMNCLMPRPSEVIETFYKKYDESPETATNYYFDLSRDSDYIRTYRVKNDIKWLAHTPYGDMDMTINMSKPEKDPRAIKLAAKQAGGEKYPACMLCKENEGYAGRLDHPARENHRMIPIKVAGQDWFMQYSPYVYYNEHSIFLNGEHVPMKIDRQVFIKLLDIIKFLPHYFVGSNAGLPIVGGSILAHEHFQGGRYEFAMAKAPIETEIHFDGYDDMTCGIVKWPMTVIRVNGKDADRVVDLCDKILSSWKKYTDESVFIYAFTDGAEHNTVTPIARKRGDNYEIDLVLRNNITTDEYPDGVYHAHPEYHHIKRENIGLIEVMGLAVLPSRLKAEMEELEDAMLEGVDIAKDEKLSKHAEWVEEIRQRHSEINRENIDDIIKEEIGVVFYKILENCGVFKRDDKGQAALMKFVKSIKTN